MTNHLRRSGSSLARWLAAALLGIATVSLLPSQNAVHGGTIHMLVVCGAAFAWKIVIDQLLERFRRR